ncbi:basic helix-loop-helix ARNT-like protein 2 isoform X2 [Betta splendens]|uniref:Basic helix-loop-helix ARNT-like protein 2 isoform X2 n=1 Tax=Betta splendens TaxID=158456 RepID=A0A9W2Y0H8_BETSP|nr:basic helix-loop-helix ARNT-like protein 2 isoform X2 [Betta splendens]
MSAGGSDGTAAGTSDPAAEEEGLSQTGSSLPAVELPRKRKGDVEKRQITDFQKDDDLSRSEEEDQQVKMKCFREPHRQIEKRRRDKMNNLIDELAVMIPACQPMARKLDKLTVLRKAVQHLKALKVGASSVFTDTAYKPSILPHEDLRHLLLKAADGFLLVVSCDRAKILFISESVSKILNFSQMELTGQSLFDFIHPKDINKVKEQLSSSELTPRQRVIDAASGVQLQPDVPAKPSHLSTGARRSFFCRMKHSATGREVAGKHEDKLSLPSTSKKKDTYRYCTLYCTGYMRTWPGSQLDSEGDVEKETSSLTCLVTVCRLNPHASSRAPKDVHVKPTEFVTRYAIDVEAVRLDDITWKSLLIFLEKLQASSVICHRRFLARHVMSIFTRTTYSTLLRITVLRSREKIETQCYRFKTKHGSHVSLQSQWFSFTNPWTKEVEFIVSLNRVVSRGPGHTKDDQEAGSSKALQDDTKQIPIIPGLSSGVGKMIYAGSIGTQIAHELIDSYRVNSSPSSEASSPFGPTLEKLVSPQTSRSASSKEDSAGSSSHSQSEPATAAAAAGGSAASESTGESSQLDLDSMVPGLSSFSTDEAAMAVIMSLLETDVNMGQSGDFEDLHWPF